MRIYVTLFDAVLFVGFFLFVLPFFALDYFLRGDLAEETLDKLKARHGDLK